MRKIKVVNPINTSAQPPVFKKVKFFVLFNRYSTLNYFQYLSIYKYLDALCKIDNAYTYYP